MGTLLRSLAILLVVLIGATSAGRADVAFGSYHALVIGNNDYRHLPKLKTAVQDATAVAQVLRDRYGFAVTLLLNADRSEILTEINRLRLELGENDNLLIYYAGHGTLDRRNQTGFWLPVDADEEMDVNWIANDALTRYLRSMAARHVMVVADSCYSGTLVRGAESWQREAVQNRDEWLRRMASRRSRTALVSGGLEPVVDAGRGGHSVFANALLRALRENNEIMEGQTLFQRLRRSVVVNAEQTPQYSDIRLADHEGGEFLLVPKGVSVSQPSTKPSSVPAMDDKQAEIVFWESIRDSQDPSLFQVYLDQYPNGVFASLARLRRDQLQAEEKTEPTAEESVVALTVPPAPKPPADEKPTLDYSGDWRGEIAVCGRTASGHDRGYRIDLSVDKMNKVTAQIWVNFVYGEELAGEAEGYVIDDGEFYMTSWSAGISMEGKIDLDSGRARGQVVPADSRSKVCPFTLRPSN